MSYRIERPGVVATLLAFSVMSIACGNPIVPDPPPSPELNYTVSGAITEMTAGGTLPVEGVRLTVLRTQLWAITDANGLYSIPGVTSRAGNISLSKDGYKPSTTTFASTADLRLDFRVERLTYYTLSGLAYEITAAGRVPLAGIVLYCDGCGSPVGHTVVTTDAEGLYRFAWVPPGITELMVEGKEGYAYVGPASQFNGWSIVSIRTPGDTRFDFEFVRR
jgi:hypothetical protein